MKGVSKSAMAEVSGVSTECLLLGKYGKMVRMDSAQSDSGRVGKDNLDIERNTMYELTLDGFEQWLRARETGLLGLKGQPLAQEQFGQMIDIELPKAFAAIDLLEEFKEYVAGDEFKSWGDTVSVRKLSN